MDTPKTVNIFNVNNYFQSVHCFVLLKQMRTETFISNRLLIVPVPY
jgi:hypothetical protein